MDSDYELEYDDESEFKGTRTYFKRYKELNAEFTALKKLIDNLNPALDNIKQKMLPIKSELKLTTDTLSMLNKLTVNFATNLGQYLGNSLINSNTNVNVGNKINYNDFLEKILNNMFLPIRAIGGNIAAAQTYLVGEKGPELFTSHASGTITPNNKLPSKQMPINVVVNLNTQSNNYFNKTTNQNLRELSRAMNKINKKF